MKIIILEQKDPGETIPILVDFSDDLVGGETINGASCAPTVSAGTDPSPTSILNGVATFTGSVVTQVIKGGIAGVIYMLAFTVTTTSSHNYVKVGSLAVVNAANPY